MKFSIIIPIYSTKDNDYTVNVNVKYIYQENLKSKAALIFLKRQAKRGYIFITHTLSKAKLSSLLTHKK